MVKSCGFVLRAACLIGLWAGMAPEVSAQTTGSVRGVATDDRGRPLAGATVTVGGGALPAAGRGTLTDASGVFLIPGLPPGRDYQARASFPGQATVVHSDVVVEPGRTTVLTLALPPESSLRERIRVRASPQIVNPAVTVTETRLSSEFIEALPVLGRNYQDVLTLAPGVTDVEGTGNPNIHGARDTDVVTLVDGVSTTDPLTGRVGAQLNLESIQEIEVKSAGATAEFGRAQGGFANIITKSGGNDFEGTFKFFWRGNLLDGDGAGTDDPRLHAGLGERGLRDLKFNDFLPFLALGGPIVKDRAWFYVALEHIRREDPVNALTQSFVTGIREDRQFVKLTWQATPNQRVALSVNYDPQRLLNEGVNGLTLEETGFTIRQGGTVLTLKDTLVLGPSAALETTVSRFDQRPALLPNLSPDTNGNGILFNNRNGNGFDEPFERDAGEDFDDDGAFDVYEDTILPNGILDAAEVFLCCFDNELRQCTCQPYSIIVDEDADHDRRLTKRGGCEGLLREDFDCDGHFDRFDEDRNHNGHLDPGEDVDMDGFLDPGDNDRNRNRRLDDTPFPTDLDPRTNPYGRLRPLPADRDYTVNQLNRAVSGPYFEEFSDRRSRYTLRQDLSVFATGLRGTHDLKLGFVVERERFDRLNEDRVIVALKDPPFPVGGFAEAARDPAVCNTYLEACADPRLGRILTLVPGASSGTESALGRTSGLYVQDVYKPRPNLSIGVGVRFERENTDASGFSSFDPAQERRLFDRLFALSGGEKGAPRSAIGDDDGLTSNGILSDPLLNGPAGPSPFGLGIAEALRRAAPSRLTLSRSQFGFTLQGLAALYPEILQGGEVDPARLAALGIRVQQADSFAITNNNLSPRLSVSWDPWSDGRTKLFATWGRYYDKLFLSSVTGEQRVDRLARYYVRDPDGFTTQLDPLNGRITGWIANHHIGETLSKAPSSISQVDRGLRTPFSDEFTLGFEREIAPEVALTLRFISRRFRDGLQDIDLNHDVRRDPATGALADRFGLIGEIPSDTPGTPSTQFVAPDGRPDLYINNFLFNQILRVTNANEARYRGIELGIVRRLSRRWQMDTSYTYSRAIGAAEDFQSRFGNDPSTIESEFGYLDYDQRHVVKINGISFLPGDWQLGFTASWSSGLPYSVISQFFAADDVNYLQYRTRYGFTSLEDDELAFRGLKRNSERNQSVYDLNLRVKKGFVIGRSSAALMAEVFNVLNTDDLRVRTFAPAQGTGIVPGSGAAASTPLQLDETRRFGRRFQIGFQIDF